MQPNLGHQRQPILQKQALQSTNLPSTFSGTSYTLEEYEKIRETLNKQLGPEFISTRQGPSGVGKLVYVEGWKVINLANNVFGFNGWSSSIQNITIDFVETSQDTGRISVGISVTCRVTLKDGAYHEDLGYGTCENSKSKAAAFEKAKKEAMTDALKRALRTFGNAMGNCVYDKKFTSEIVKIKISPPQFNVDKLHRNPDFIQKAVKTGDKSNKSVTDKSAECTPQHSADKTSNNNNKKSLSQDNISTNLTNRSQSQETTPISLSQNSKSPSQILRNTSTTMMNKNSPESTSKPVSNLTPPRNESMATMEREKCPMNNSINKVTPALTSNDGKNSPKHVSSSDSKQEAVRNEDSTTTIDESRAAILAQFAAIDSKMDSFLAEFLADPEDDVDTDLMTEQDQSSFQLTAKNGTGFEVSNEKSTIGLKDVNENFNRSPEKNNFIGENLKPSCQNISPKRRPLAQNPNIFSYELSPNNRNNNFLTVNNRTDILLEQKVGMQFNEIVCNKPSTAIVSPSRTHVDSFDEDIMYSRQIKRRKE
ncbi:19966_t:CDS:10 [Dentiscutata erythropus]|uniref:19966_t:CDS:1 n=1 Tax=Dentiscutata erythropus TaxID=1348616 RepID=A0A9N9GDY7_9GLOM|nr:19966_t:CDS:10 [Dentiscutata erythropus]